MPLRVFDAGRIQQPFNTEIVQRIKSKEFSKFIHGFSGRYQLSPSREIDAIVAGKPVRWTGNPHMYTPDA
jgi:hypothetical protein